LLISWMGQVSCNFGISDYGVTLKKNMETFHNGEISEIIHTLPVLLDTPIMLLKS